MTNVSLKYSSRKFSGIGVAAFITVLVYLFVFGDAFKVRVMFRHTEPKYVAII